MGCDEGKLHRVLLMTAWRAASTIRISLKSVVCAAHIVAMHLLFEESVGADLKGVRFIRFLTCLWDNEYSRTSFIFSDTNMHLLYDLV